MAEPDLDAAAHQEDEADSEPGSEIEAETAARLRLVVARLARQLRQHAAGGLTPSQTSALFTIDHAGPLRLGELAVLEGVAPPTITRVVGALVEGGLVERSGDPDDARSARVAVTEAGHGTVMDIRAERTALLAQRLGRLTAEQRKKLPTAVRLLELLSEVDPQ